MSPFAGYDNFDACVSDNQDKDNPDALCAEIKRQVEGEASLSDSQAKALAESDCGEGHVSINGQCVPIEEVDAPPGVLNMSLPSPIHLAEFDAEEIERLEEGDNTVRYTQIKLIGPGMWTDSASREQVWYSPKGMQNLEVDPDNEIHIFHDEDNEISKVGEIDAESVTNTEEGVYADIVIDTSNAAGEFADQNMQQTLETGGAQGFGGPSVEIPPDGQQVEFNASKGMPELQGGKIDGLGLVKNPAAKDVHFARQTAQRGVALSDSQEVMVLEGNETNMAEDTIEAAQALETLGLEADELDLEDRELDDVPAQELVSLIAEAYGADPADLMEALDPFLNGNEDGEEDRENQEDEEDQPGGDEEDEGDDEEDDEEDDMDMSTRVDALEERLQNVEDMMESAMQAEDVEEQLSEELEDAKSDLADAETVQELSEAKEELDRRLSELEDEPDKPRSLADRDTDDIGPISPIETRDRGY